jgi:hypothetical protein
MKLKLAVLALAAIACAPVLAQKAVMSSNTSTTASTTLIVPPGSTGTVILGPVSSSASAGSTAVLGGPAAPAVRIDITNGWNIPPGAERRADFQRWLRLWP